MGSSRKKDPPHPAKDLFGEIPVTWPEVESWVRAAIGMPPEHWRFAWYVKNWNVPDKIRAAKLAGTWQ